MILSPVEVMRFLRSESSWMLRGAPGNLGRDPDGPVALIAGPPSARAKMN